MMWLDAVDTKLAWLSWLLIPDIFRKVDLAGCVGKGVPPITLSYTQGQKYSDNKLLGLIALLQLVAKGRWYHREAIYKFTTFHFISCHSEYPPPLFRSAVHRKSQTYASISSRGKHKIKTILRNRKTSCKTSMCCQIRHACVY